MDQDIFKGIPHEMIAIAKGMILFFYAIIGVVYFLYIRNLFGLMKLVKPENRRLQPSLVWFLSVNFLSALAVIPLFLDKELAVHYQSIFNGIQIGILVFMLIFTFYMVNKISESLDAELRSRNISDHPKPTLNIGLFMCICNTGGLLSGIGFLAILGVFASLAGVVAWIMYWIKTSEYRNLLKTIPQSTSLNDLGIF
jgi:hypothetical protein